MCNQLVFAECSFIAEGKGVKQAFQKFSKALLEETDNYEW